MPLQDNGYDDSSSITSLVMHHYKTTLFSANLAKCELWENTLNWKEQSHKGKKMNVNPIMSFLFRKP